MRTSEIEYWALNIIDRVKNGQPNEDSRVELKTIWLDPVEMARRLAGHANAARGGPILWLVGVNEKAGAVPGVQARDAAQWWPQVQKHFDGLAPTLTDLAVPHGSVTVMALFFETDRTPFVVKNPDGGKIGFEVPWRDGTATRTARRDELLRILVPATRLPEVEIGSVVIGPDPRSTRAVLGAEAYFEPVAGTTNYIAFHRCSVRVRTGGRPWLDLGEVKIRPHAEPDPEEMGIDPEVDAYLPSLTIRRSETEVEIRGPGFAHIEAKSDLDVWSESIPMDRLAPSEPLHLEVKLGVSRCPVPLTISRTLKPMHRSGTTFFEWGEAQDPTQP